MKNKMNILNSIGFGLLLVAVTACQQGSNSQKSEYQRKTNALLSKSARGISSTYAALPRPSGRGAVDPYYGQQQYPFSLGQNVLGPTPYDTSSECLNQARLIPRTSANFEAAMGVYASCLNILITRSNPIMTMGTRDLDPRNGQGMWTYLSAGVPVPYNQFQSSQSSFNPLMLYLMNGFTGGSNTSGTGNYNF